MSQLTCSCNLVEKAFATDDYMSFFPLASYFYDIFAWPCTNLHLWAFCFFLLFFLEGAFAFSSFLIFLLQLLTLYLACFQSKNSWESIIKAGGSYHGVGKGNFAPSYSLKFPRIFVCISDFIDLVILIWVSLERTFPPAEHEYGECQFCSK